MKRSVGQLEALAQDEPPRTKKLRPALGRFPSTYLKNYHCSFSGCDRAYSKPSKLADHERSHTGERPFSCTEPGCGKNFLRKSHLQAHARSHLPKEERPYVCKHTGCGQRFSTNQHLRQHVELHSQPTPYRCDTCGESFKKNFQLKRHIADAHLHTKPCPCPTVGCGMSFAYQSILDKHIARVHDETKRYSCGMDDCDAEFSKWSGLQAHIKDLHKLKCKYCNKAYSEPAAYKLHLETHEIPLEDRLRLHCPIDACGKRFAKPYSLKRHVAVVHEGLREFTCEICDKGFAHNKTLRDHTRREHPHGEIKCPSPKKQKRTSRTAQASVLDRLTGINYEDSGREIQCIAEDCLYRFTRAYDLDRHLATGIHPELEISVEALRSQNLCIRV